MSQCVGDDRTDIEGLMLRAWPEVRLQHFAVERLRNAPARPAYAPALATTGSGERPRAVDSGIIEID